MCSWYLPPFCLCCLNLRAIRPKYCQAIKKRRIWQGIVSPIKFGGHPSRMPYAVLWQQKRVQSACAVRIVTPFFMRVKSFPDMSWQTSTAPEGPIPKAPPGIFSVLKDLQIAKLLYRANIRKGCGLSALEMFQRLVMCFMNLSVASTSWHLAGRTASASFLFPLCCFHQPSLGTAIRKPTRILTTAPTAGKFMLGKLSKIINRK